MDPRLKERSLEFRERTVSERLVYTSSINLGQVTRVTKSKSIEFARCRTTSASNSSGIADRYLPPSVPSIHEITPKLLGYPGLRVIHERRREFDRLAAREIHGFPRELDANLTSRVQVLCRTSLRQLNNDSNDRSLPLSFFLSVA